MTLIERKKFIEMRVEESQKEEEAMKSSKK
jgi:hypothetical protein